MTEHVWRVGPLAFEAAELLAQILAFKLRVGDCVALSGDVGAGKTTLSRAIIRSIVSDPDLDVASPTYALMQSYACSRAEIQHYDFYRLERADEVLEIGFDDDVSDRITLVEWPERAEEVLPESRIDIDIGEMLAPDGSEVRHYTIQAYGAIGGRLKRCETIWKFLTEWLSDEQAFADLSVSYLQGDASARAYAMLQIGDASWILMDSPRQPDGPPIRDGKSYSQLAHLAEDICPFVAIAHELGAHGFAVPKIDAVDFNTGLAVIEDFGPKVFGSLIEGGHEKTELYSAATNVLVQLSQLHVPKVLQVQGCTYAVPAYDHSVLLIETELLLDWYFRWVSGGNPSESLRHEFLSLWSAQLHRLEALPKGWVLRDFHSPNLIWLPERREIERVGLIDFQDAQIGHAAYDLVSLLQDARLDVDAELEAKWLDSYCAARSQIEAGFDGTSFRWAYAVLGAQRNTKILGIFARLAERDGKPQYLRHIPRITGYVRRNLEHPDLEPLKVWYHENLPGLVDA